MKGANMTRRPMIRVAAGASAAAFLALPVLATTQPASAVVPAAVAINPH